MMVAKGYRGRPYAGRRHSGEMVRRRNDAGSRVNRAASEQIMQPSGTYDPDEVTPLQGLDPTRDMYEDLNRAFRFFNERLFEGKLQPSLITVRATGRTYGYFSAGRFVDTGKGKRVNEIAFNPEAFAQRGVEDVLSTLVHEMVHQQQYEGGTASRRAYHNKDFEKKMRAVGLVPSATGLPGGPSVGEKVTHYVDVDGPFLAAAKELVDAEFRLRWSDRFITQPYPRVVFAKAVDGAPARRRSAASNAPQPGGADFDDDPFPPLPSEPATPAPTLAAPEPAAPPGRPMRPATAGCANSAEPASLSPASAPGAQPSPAPAEILGGLQVLRPKPRASASKSKHVCPSCGNAAWGKPSLRLVCGDCSEPYVLTTE